MKGKVPPGLTEHDIFQANSSMFHTQLEYSQKISDLPFVLLLVLALPFSLLAQNGPLAQPSRIAGLLDPNQSVALKGNIHPKASVENDLGPVPRDLSLYYITLHLKPTPAQQTDLDQFLIQLQIPSSPNYHHWLTPEQFADRFGASPTDIAQIVAWLEGQGLTVISRARGRNFVVFKGNVGRVEAALHVSIHKFLVDGEVHFANATEPWVPTAIQSFTVGFSGLDDFKPKPPSHISRPVFDAVFNKIHGSGPGTCGLFTTRNPCTTWVSLDTARSWR